MISFADLTSAKSLPLFVISAIPMSIIWLLPQMHCYFVLFVWVVLFWVVLDFDSFGLLLLNERVFVVFVL